MPTPNDVHAWGWTPEGKRILHAIRQEAFRTLAEHEGLEDGNPVLDFVSSQFSDWLNRVKQHGAEPFPGTSSKSALGAALGTLQLATGGEALRGPEAALMASEAGSQGSRAAQLAQAVRRAATGSTATRAIRGVRTAGRIATAPIRHPVLASAGTVAAQAPAAVVHGDLGEFMKALEGTGVAADITGKLGSAAISAIPGVGGHAVADALSLPAQVLPSLYLTGRAGVNAALGHPKEALDLWQQLLDTSALAALAQGHPGEAVQRFGEHPLYAALEALAVKSAVGHAAGFAARNVGGAGAREWAAKSAPRPPVNVYGDVKIERRPYSNDLITRAFQKARDARRTSQGTPSGLAPWQQAAGAGESALQATPREAAKYLRSALDREIFAGEQVRRGNQQRVAHEINAARPSDPAQADVVSLGIQGIARNPQRAIEDLRSYRDHLVEVQPKLTASELKTNRQMIGVIDAALKNPDPAAIFHAAENFISVQKPINDALVKKGLLSESQARKAIAIPYARTHMGAGYGLSKADTAMLEQIKSEMSNPNLTSTERGQLLGRYSRVSSRRRTLDAQGEPLTLDAIEAHMNANGVGQRGFVTQRIPPASGPSTYFSPPNERPSLRTRARTGEATTRGAFDPKWEAVVEQAIHGQTVLDRVHNFERIVDRFGLRGPGGRSFANYSEAKRAAEHPADFNMKLPDIPGGWTPIRTSPWLAKKAEVEAAHGLGGTEALEADRAAMVENFSADALKNALTPGDGPTILIPKVIADRLRHHFQEQLPLEKAAQAVTGAFKGAVLPTSPGWAAGNLIDNYIVRSFGTGITPRDMATGKRFASIIEKNLSPEDAARALESITPGGLYGAYARIQPYRALDQFIGTRVEPFARAAHAFLTTPGVKTLADLYRRYRDTVFELDGKYIETFPQYGQLAKTARTELAMTRRQFRKAVASEEPVVVDLAKGLRNPEKVDRWAKDVEAVFGNWGKSSPEARRFLTTWSPFWQWARNAIKFAFITLPRDHPMLTGLIAASEQMTREERQKLGFDFGGAEPLPHFLQAGIPDPWHAGGAVKLSNLTTFGTFADLPSFLAQIPAPQFSQLVLGGLGLDWKGDKLVKADGTPAGAPERIKAAVLGTLDGYVPFLNVARQIASHGVVAGINPIRSYPADTVQRLREPRQQISVSVAGSSSGGSATPFDAYDKSLGSSEASPFDAYDKALSGR